MFIAMTSSLVQGLWHLLHYQYWTLTRAPLFYPIVALCPGDSVALDLQALPLNMFQQNRDEVGIRVG